MIRLGRKVDGLWVGRLSIISRATLGIRRRDARLPRQQSEIQSPAIGAIEASPLLASVMRSRSNSGVSPTFVEAVATEAGALHLDGAVHPQADRGHLG